MYTAQALSYYHNIIIGQTKSHTGLQLVMLGLLTWVSVPVPIIKVHVEREW